LNVSFQIACYRVESHDDFSLHRAGQDKYSIRKTMVPSFVDFALANKVIISDHCACTFTVDF